MATVTQRDAPVSSTRHRRLEAAIWNNTNAASGKTFYTCSLSKSWKDGEEWKKSTANFGSNDLLPAAKLIDWADATVGKAIDRKAKPEVEGKPLATKTRGLLEIAVWHKLIEDGDKYNVSLQRKFKDGGSWKKVTVYLLPNELLAAKRLLERSFDAVDEMYANSDNSSAFVAKANDVFNANDEDEDIPF